MKILVIDDEKPTLSMFRLFLSAYGYQVFVAESGKEGISLFEKEQPRIVFTDLKMPGMDGIEVLKKINSLCSSSSTNPSSSTDSILHAPNSIAQVIIITGHGDMDKAIEALDLNASDFINKPVEKQALDSALKRAELRIRDAAQGRRDTITHHRCATTLSIRIAGKVTTTSQAARQLSNFRQTHEFSGIEKLCIQFDQSFSINKKGILWLMNFLADIRAMNIPITMEGLSYNYIRFFEMAGLHEIADIAEAQIDE